MAYEPHWEALAIGSAHGFALIDLKTHAVVYKRLTHGLQISSEPTVTSVTRDAANKIVVTGRHLKETLRDSFRKIKRIRPHAHAHSTTAEPTESAATKGDDEVGKAASGVVDEAIAAAATEAAVDAPKPAEAAAPENGVASTSQQQPEAAEEKEAESATPHQLKPTDTTSGVSALALVDTFVVPGIPAAAKENRPAYQPPRSAALIAGTQKGALLTHTLTWAGETAPIEVKPIKEVPFQHAAPVLSVMALDGGAHYAPVVTEKSRSVAEMVPEPPEPVAAEGGDNVASAAATAAETGELREPGKVALNHELLVCTEEQVRMIALPSLKTKQKYHFWEKTGTGVYGSLKPSALLHRGKSEPSNATCPHADDNVATTAATVDTKEDAEQKEGETAAQSAPVATPEPESAEVHEKAEESTAAVAGSTDGLDAPKTSTCPEKQTVALRRVISFGLQQFPQLSTAESGEWHAVVALKNGRIHILTVPGLRRILKAKCCDRSECCGEKTITPRGIPHACVSSCSNLVFWPLSGCLLAADEISYAPPSRLMSPISVSGLKVTEGKATYCVCLPEWARPKPPPPPATTNAAATAADAAKAATAAEHEHDEDGVSEKTGEEAKESGKEELKGGIADPTESADTAKEVDDFTKDMTKGILADGSGTVTVKTTESSLEKHTVIEGGNVLTTVHETERVDGEVVKDDIVQVKSDVDENASLQAGTEVTA